MSIDTTHIDISLKSAKKELQKGCYQNAIEELEKAYSEDVFSSDTLCWLALTSLKMLKSKHESMEYYKTENIKNEAMHKAVDHLLKYHLDRD